MSDSPRCGHQAGTWVECEFPPVWEFRSSAPGRESTEGVACEVHLEQALAEAAAALGGGDMVAHAVWKMSGPRPGTEEEG